MELIFIAFLGTLVLMAAELRDFVRRPRVAASATAAVIAPGAATGSAAHGSHGKASPSRAHDAYDEAA